MATVTGTLLDYLGNPVEGKTIVLHTTGGNGDGDTAITDVNGQVEYTVHSNAVEIVEYTLECPELNIETLVPAEVNYYDDGGGPPPDPDSGDPITCGGPSAGVRVTWTYVNLGVVTTGSTDTLVNFTGGGYVSTSAGTDPTMIDQSGILPGNAIVPDESWAINFAGLVGTMSTSLNGSTVNRTLGGGYPTCITGSGSPFTGPPAFQTSRITTLGFFHYYSVGVAIWM